MITFLLGFTIGVLMSIGVVAYYAHKMDKENKEKSKISEQNIEKALKDLFQIEDEDEKPATILNLVKKDDDDEPTKH